MNSGAFTVLFSTWQPRCARSTRLCGSCGWPSAFSTLHLAPPTPRVRAYTVTVTHPSALDIRLAVRHLHQVPGTIYDACALTRASKAHARAHTTIVVVQLDRGNELFKLTWVVRCLGFLACIVVHAQ